MPTLESVVRRAWSHVPPAVRQARWMARPKQVVRAAVGPLPSPPVADAAPVIAEGPPVTEPPHGDEQRVVRTLDELDEMLRFLDEAAAVSDDELRRGFATFRMELDLQLPPDPYSTEYRDAVFELYAWLRGRPYDTSQEGSAFDVAGATDVPFPYTTQSGSTVGNHLIAIGHIIRTLDLPPGSRVLEFGPGWGNTTVTLARMGHHVTAIDIEPRFVELIAARAERIHARVEVLQGDFSIVSDLDGQYDAVLFFECFHHCADHLSLLAELDGVVAPGGRVLFAAEPISDALPAPWGLRLDGESLWAIRQNGWFELGFQESYFVATLERYGWHLDKVVCPETPWGVIFVATRLEPAVAQASTS